MHPLAHILGKCALISVVAPFYNLPKPHHRTASHPSPGDKPPKREMGSERTQEPSRNGRVNSSINVYIRALHSFLSFIVEQPSPSSHCSQRPPSHHPSNLTSVNPVPTLHLLPPSTPFYHTVHLHSLPLSKPCQYSDTL